MQQKSNTESAEIPTAKIVSVPARLLAAVMTAVFFVLAFPKYDLGWIAWAAMIPLLLAIFGGSRKRAFVLSLISGVIFFTAVFSWTFEIPGYKPLHHVVLGLYTGLYFGIFGWVFNFINRRSNIVTALSSAPFVWVALEYLRSNFFFLALPWALLGHTQYKYPWIIQFAAVTGAYGISFLIVLVNSALALLILVVLSKSTIIKRSGLSLPSTKSTISLILSAAVLSGIVLLYGYFILSGPTSGNAISLSVLQGNIDRQKKADPKKYAAHILQTYTDLTRKAAADKPDLILWPEASTPGFVMKNRLLSKKISTLIAETRTHFLIGSSEYPKFIKDRPLKPEDVGNTALYYSPKGHFLGQYLKIHLVPFGEYIPYENFISWPSFIVPEEKKTFEIPGKEYTLFSLGDSKFGAIICWEVVFPQLFRAFVRTGANFMINLTNEGWFGDSAAPHQMAAIVAIRAVENRVPVARAANTGISCFIDAYGRITGMVKDSTDKPTYVEGYLTMPIRPSKDRTFYTRHGDVFAGLNAIIAIVFLVTGLISGRRQT